MHDKALAALAYTQEPVDTYAMGLLQQHALADNLDIALSGTDCLLLLPGRRPGPSRQCRAWEMSPLQRAQVSARPGLGWHPLATTGCLQVRPSKRLCHSLQVAVQTLLEHS